MEERIYIRLKKENQEFLDYLKTITDVNSFFILNEYTIIELDDRDCEEDILESIKNAANDFYADYRAFVDKVMLEGKTLEIAISFIDNKQSGIYYLDDLLTNIILKGDYVSKHYFRTFFQRKIPDYLIETGLVFIDKGNAITAAKELYVHRNTLNYRLDCIKKVTSLDLREFKCSFAFYGLYN